MKNIFISTLSILLIFNANAQIKPMPGFYPEGVFKREQRIKTSYITTSSKPNEVSTNMRSVGKAYVLKPGYRQDETTTQAEQKGKQHVEYTFTEIFGVKTVDGNPIDLGNPIEDFTVYAYRANYNNKGEAIEWDGKKIYMDAMENGNLQILDPGYQCTYFLHSDVPRNVGDVWVDSQFCFPLTKKITSQLTFEKMEKIHLENNLKTDPDVEVARLNLTGNVNVKGVVTALNSEKMVNLSGTITAFIHVDPRNNRIHRFKGEIKLKGEIMMNGKMQPYDITMKVNEWSMDPSNVWK